jgi:predicted aconitase with swiveling domain
LHIVARSISRGVGTGELLVSPAPISFLSGVDPETGIIVEKGHPLYGKCIAGKVLAFPFGKGSTVGSYVLYALSRNGHAPAAIINEEAEPIIVTGAIIAKIPMVDRISVPLGHLKDGVLVTVDGDRGELEYEGTLPGS